MNDRMGNGIRPTAIVAAMAEELAAMGPYIQHRTRSRLGGIDVVTGWWGAQPVVLSTTGDGAARARAGLERLLAVVPAHRLVVVGIAGALSPELMIGQVVAADRVLDERGGAHVPDAGLMQAALAATGLQPAAILSADRIADDPIAKQRLSTLARSASGGPAVVDLESATYAEVARAAGVPWLILRAVSDAAGEGLPALLNRSRDQGGAVRRSRVLRGLLTNPGALPSLLALRGRLQRCSQELAAALAVVLPCLAASNDPTASAPAPRATIGGGQPDEGPSP